MSLAAPSRVVLRQSRALLRRPAYRQSSSTSDAAAKTKEVASKASENLSKVAATAGPAIAGAAQGIAGALRKVGGRTAKVVSFVERMIPPTIYYSKVGLELSKIVFRGQKMQPPSLATFQEYFSPIISALRQPSALASRLSDLGSVVSRVRTLDRKQWAFVGVTAAEVIGFFSVGEIIGRRKIVGYRGETGHEEH
ncbi:hypothetical protein VTO42DRAFT_5946 [Malbranchea cinnamomea]